jgi:predicted TIM-barrel fold metal-dependent hydrolase
MIFDLHVHIGGLGAGGSGNYVAPRFRRSYAFRFFSKRMGFSLKAFPQPDDDRQIASRVVKWLDASMVDRAVLLGFDAAYREDGRRDEQTTLFVTDNDFVADLAVANRKVLFGASIHPYRHDAVPELERLIKRGACLIKWLPGAQNIQPDHSRCFPFYEAMAHHQIPLLCHTGSEHTLKTFPDALNDPRRLVPALERGVTVMAAHCGARLYLHEKSYLRQWQELALRYERFYGDISAFGVITRIWPLRRLLKSPELTAKLLFGSDFPAAPLPMSCVGCMSLGRARELRQMTNPFDQAVEMMKAAGVPNAVFERAGQLLRIPKLEEISKPSRMETR